MKKLHLLLISLLSISASYAQDINDALRYSQNEIQGTARFRALSGAFGALGGDMSAVGLNPAGSAIFNRSHVSFTASNSNIENNTNYFNNSTASNKSNFDINQAGAAFVFTTNYNSPWKKVTLAITYDRTKNYNNNWVSRGTNTNNDGAFSNSIASYFYDYANGKRLDEISTFPDESIDDAYRDIGYNHGFEHQQAFLGFESHILEPENINDDANSIYLSNINSGDFYHDYSYLATGYNGKVTFNFATQYEDNLYLGINLNSHFIDYSHSTLLLEDNSNGSFINEIDFENNLTTRGNGISFQLGGILKITHELRAGLTYESPTWYTIEEETTQYLSTNGDNGFIEIYPNVINLHPRYRLQTPAKVSGSLAYIFGNSGLISFDYSRKNYETTKFKPTSDTFFANQNEIISNTLTNASTYRIGGEYKYNQFSFRGGYRFEESPYKNHTTIGDLNGFSAGIGYNFGNTILDLTYDQSERNLKTPLYNVGLIDTTSINRKNTNLTLSLSFNI